MGKFAKILLLTTAVTQGPRQAARDFVFADEVEYVFGTIGKETGDTLSNFTGGSREGLQYARIGRWT